LLADGRDGAKTQTKIEVELIEATDFPRMTRIDTDKFPAFQCLHPRPSALFAVKMFGGFPSVAASAAAGNFRPELAIARPFPHETRRLSLMKLTVATSCAALAALSACTSVPQSPAGRAPAAREFWLDLARGDEVSDHEVLADLAGAGVIFVGEAHTIARHHAVQLRLLQELFASGVPLALCLEQLEARDQPAVDRYFRRELDFAALARAIDWPKKWTNYADYRPLCEFAQQHGIPIRALNAPAEIIRAVSRGGGVAKLAPADRAQLPAEIVLDDPGYERLTNLELAVHMTMDPAKLRPVFEAQVARDETMAANVVAGRRMDAAPDKLRTAFVVLGAGHMRFGLGTADRVRRRDPGIVERLVIVSESDQLKLTESQKTQARDITISHGDLRAVGRLPADYVRVLPLTAPAGLPPGHPPIEK
jgi:uncharacterized iron-regulated protein